jgi:hypothetical protein
MKLIVKNRILLAFGLIMCFAVVHFMGSADRPNNLNGLPKMQASQIVSASDNADPQKSAYHLTAGICALLLVGYLFWFMIRKFQNDSRAELNSRKNSFYMISLATGRTEYELFHKSAEGWSVSAERINQDFKRYMSDQIMPHYAMDFVRKNQTHIDESLIVKKEVKPTSWSDWAIAMLVFPGSLLLLYILMLLFDKY